MSNDIRCPLGHLWSSLKTDFVKEFIRRKMRKFREGLMEGICGTTYLKGPEVRRSRTIPLI